MANPYHDSAGQFCSKGEMLSEIKQLAKDGKFQTYFVQRKAFEEIQRTSNISKDEALDDAIYNMPVISNVTPEASLISYELAKDKLGRDFDEGMVRSLLNSRYLPEEARADIIARSSQWGIDRVIETNYVDHSLSATDYRNIVARPDMEPSYPYIAKDDGISFEEKKLLIGNTTWGLGLLAMHNPKEFFEDTDATEKLRNSLGDPEHNSTVVYGLAESPYEEDHVRILDNPDLNDGGAIAANSLALNKHLSLDNARTLLRSQIARESTDAGWVAGKLHMQHEYARAGKESWGERVKEKISYNQPELSDTQKQELKSRIASLRAGLKSDSYREPEKLQANFLEGKVYADNKTFRSYVKEYDKLKRQLGRKEDEDKHERLLVLEKRLVNAKSVRRAYHILETLDQAAANR